MNAREAFRCAYRQARLWERCFAAPAIEKMPAEVRRAADCRLPGRRPTTWKELLEAWVPRRDSKRELYCELLAGEFYEAPDAYRRPGLNTLQARGIIS